MTAKQLITFGALATLASAGGPCYFLKKLGSKYGGDFCEKSYPNEKANCIEWGKATIKKCTDSAVCDKAFKTGQKTCQKAIYKAKKDFWTGSDIESESLANCFSDVFNEYGDCAAPVRTDFNDALPDSPEIEGKEFKAYLKKYQKAAMKQLKAEYRAAKKAKKSSKRSSRR